MTTREFNYALELSSEYLKPYANSLTKNAEDAQDLYQETLYKALVNKEKYNIGTNLKAWLYTIMRNTFINDYRKNKRFSKVSNEVPEDIIVYNSGRNVNNQGWSNSRMSEIKQALHNLPDVFRQSFELYYLGYKYQDIATILSEPLGTVKSRIHFARKQLTSTVDR